MLDVQFLLIGYMSCENSVGVCVVFTLSPAFPASPAGPAGPGRP